ncbi:MAG: hypothetical protein CL947_00475 [Epsilonproteobacteria bacterium]|nr:hypothetical protein [Campylobacterota bacterium]|tara:strand:- start:789 stop:1166 length:378 start_codon:yes stop_codon:yes gene_type:complete
MKFVIKSILYLSIVFPVYVVTSDNSNLSKLLHKTEQTMHQTRTLLAIMQIQERLHAIEQQRKNDLGVFQTCANQFEKKLNIQDRKMRELIRAQNESIFLQAMITQSLYQLEQRIRHLEVIKINDR